MTFTVFTFLEPDTIHSLRKNKKMKEKPQFSYFNKPVRNVIPFKTITLADVYRALTSNYLKEHTNQLRLISGKAENRKFKATHFPYITASGIFSKRNEKALLKHSGLIALDFDHVENVDALKTRLLVDSYLKTELLFISPNGNGIKWVVKITVLP